MPLYEYECRGCGKQFTFLCGVVSGGKSEAQCPRCASGELKKLMSRVARGRSDDEKLDAVAEKMETRNLDDAGSMRQFAREMSREITAESGVDLRDEMEAMIEAEARGESLNDFDNSDDDQFSNASTSNADDGTIY